MQLSKPFDIYDTFMLLSIENASYIMYEFSISHTIFDDVIKRPYRIFVMKECFFLH